MACPVTSIEHDIIEFNRKRLNRGCDVAKTMQHQEKMQVVNLLIECLQKLCVRYTERLETDLSPTKRMNTIEALAECKAEMDALIKVVVKMPIYDEGDEGDDSGDRDI